MKADARLVSLRRILADEGVDALAVELPPNVAYLTGFERVFDSEPSTVCVVTAQSARVHVDSRFAEAAQAAAEGTEWIVGGPYGDVWEGVLAGLAETAVLRLGLEASLPHSRFTAIADKFQGETTPADGWVERVREVKDASEVERITAAAALGDAAFDHILGVIAPGMTEVEIAFELEMHMRRQGSDGLAFASIVAGGPNSSLPHAQASDRAVRAGDLLTMDFGARVGGYVSDMTRTVVVGKASERQREIYSVVLDANEAGIAAVRPGLTGIEIDTAAREVIVAAGFGEYFGHGLGHGVGLEVHEGPRVGPRGAARVPLGAVLTVEPGVYVPGVGGARIEDLVVVGSAGAVVLSHSPKDLIEL
jgi:Xaa-Pro aminopeptidase